MLMREKLTSHDIIVISSGELAASDYQTQESHSIEVLHTGIAVHAGDEETERKQKNWDATVDERQPILIAAVRAFHRGSNGNRKFQQDWLGKK